jgi:hypothetical protein
MTCTALDSPEECSKDDHDTRCSSRRPSNQVYSLDSQFLTVPGSLLLMVGTCKEVYQPFTGSYKGGADQLFVIYLCRAGAIIKEIREASGAHIKILPAEELPPCGLSNDRVVQ